MKALARRLVNAVDMEGLLDANPALDLELVRLHLNDLAAALEQPGIVEGFEAQLRLRNSKDPPNR